MKIHLEFYFLHDDIKKRIALYDIFVPVVYADDHFGLKFAWAGNLVKQKMDEVERVKD